ncbi:hypothetical protein MMC08_004720 [Hypocenomyce scalaris]|nr:hypothetical protein [Hypocenomyce scalaris]
MASRAFLSLQKPFLRSSALQPCQAFTAQLRSNPIYKTRSFHTTPRTQFLDVCFDQVQTIITGLHSVSGLPWVATLPLTALIVRFAIVGPLSLVGHESQRRRLALQPLTNAWKHVIRREVMKEHAKLGPVACNQMAEARLRGKIRELYLRHECGSLRTFLPLLQLPIFLVVIETIRKMCGTHEGLLGLVTNALGDPVEKSGDDTLEGISQTAASVEQSLSQEGALWFPNLLAPDPYLVLPFLLSASLFANIYYLGRANSGQTPSKWSKRLTGTMKIVALAIGPATLQVPSAMLLYWISSSLFAMGQNVLLDLYYPRQIPVTPCKPRSKQEWVGLAVRG